MLLRGCPEASVQYSPDVMQDEQSLINSQFLIACHAAEDTGGRRIRGEGMGFCADPDAQKIS